MVWRRSTKLEAPIISCALYSLCLQLIVLVLLRKRAIL
ncbi:uncharacterized protein Dere_GG27199 [Drosophila erecta]|nr:uncharacterized protein Dere_GG27199 [Drosophila erecta]